MHWTWKNCPYAWQGAYQDRSKHRSCILEAVCDKSLRIWWAFFGLPGSLSDLNIVDRSPMMDKLLTGPLSQQNFTVNGRTYHRIYLLADGIYPSWTTFIQSISQPQSEMFCHFASMQEGCRKDIERCFGVLQSKFAIVAHPCRQWDLGTMKAIMYACIVMHNMIVEDESGETNLTLDFP
jgi:hypothetical protein